MIEHLLLAACALAAVGFGVLYLQRGKGMLRHKQSTISFNTLAEVAPAGIWRTRPNGECTYVNAAWKEMAGLEDGQWEDHGWTEAIHPEDRDRVLTSWINALSKNAPFREDFRWLRPDGSILWTTCLGAPEYGENGEILAYVGINTDIQRNKDRETELETALVHAEQATSAKTNFLANMSHEIRTPMNGVIGFTELLLESDLNEEQMGHVKLIADSGRAMMQLLNDILDVAKIESGQLSIVSEPVDLRQKIRHCIKLLEPMARAKRLKLGMWIDEDVPATIEADRLRLRQVMLNLIGNAVKFTETGGIDVEARVENSSSGQFLLISVIDTGIGINPDKLETIFTPFSQGDASTARRYGGSGLGLAISSQLVTMMEGRITVHSKIGVGTNFTVRLPLCEASKEAVAPVASKHVPLTPTKQLEGCKVLIAEDHAINQELIMAMARSLGLDAALAEDGDEAISMVVDADDRDEPFSLILMDMQMPQVDGLEATRRLRKMGYSPQDLPIIALTANCYPDDINECRKAGMQSHLGKPVTPVSLAREIARVLPNDAANKAPKQSKSAGPADKAAGPSEGLQQRYRDRKGALIASLRHCLDDKPENTDWDNLVNELHKLAGVAANFGEQDLGEISRRLERRLKLTPEPHLRHAALRREWPELENAA